MKSFSLLWYFENRYCYFILLKINEKYKKKNSTAICFVILFNQLWSRSYNLYLLKCFWNFNFVLQNGSKDKYILQTLKVASKTWEKYYDFDVSRDSYQFSYLVDVSQITEIRVNLSVLLNSHTISHILLDISTKELKHLSGDYTDLFCFHSVLPTTLSKVSQRTAIRNKE